VRLLHNSGFFGVIPAEAGILLPDTVLVDRAPAGRRFAGVVFCRAT
jgi:hypothetical protein